MREIESGHRRRGAGARDRVVGVLRRIDRRPATMQPFCAPFSRRMRVSLRVSMSAMPTTSAARRYADRSFCLRQLDASARQVANDEARPRRSRFDSTSSRVDADVADVRIGQRDDLPCVRRIGQDLLVAGHRGVEHDLADGVPGAPIARPRKTVPSASASNAGVRGGNSAGVATAVDSGAFIKMTVVARRLERARRFTWAALDVQSGEGQAFPAFVRRQFIATPSDDQTPSAQLRCCAGRTGLLAHPDSTGAPGATVTSTGMRSPGGDASRVTYSRP